MHASQLRVLVERCALRVWEDQSVALYGETIILTQIALRPPFTYVPLCAQPQGQLPVWAGVILNEVPDDEVHWHCQSYRKPQLTNYSKGGARSGGGA